MFDIAETKKQFEETVEHFKLELKKIRAGRANPDMIKDIKVEAYGSGMPLEQVANINVADATLLVVQPWDKTLLDEVSKAIQTANLGINPQQDGDIIRLPIPPLTAERRQEYVKLMKQKSEEAKISIRQKRKDSLDELSLYKSEGMSEDEVERNEKEIQKLVDQMNTNIDELADEKHQELTKV